MSATKATAGTVVVRIRYFPYICSLYNPRRANMIDWNYIASVIATVAFDIIYFGAIIGTIVIVILDNRNPVKTMAWILILMFLPVVGLVFYFFFGRSQRREKIIGYEQQLSRFKTIIPPDRYKIKEILHRSGGKLPVLTRYLIKSGDVRHQSHRRDLYRVHQNLFYHYSSSFLEQLYCRRYSDGR